MAGDIIPFVHNTKVHFREFASAQQRFVEDGFDEQAVGLPFPSRLRLSVGRNVGSTQLGTDSTTHVTGMKEDATQESFFCLKLVLLLCVCKE